MTLNQNQNSNRIVGRMAKSLPSLVAEQILQAILSGELPPGARLLETQLAEEHAVSRATIREALAQLERSHFVERTPRYGARVAQVNFEELEELYELRAVLLGLASQRAARLAPDDALRAFRLAAGALETLAASGVDTLTYTQEALKVQQMLIDGARSKWVKSMYDQISNQALWRVMVRGRGAVFASESRRRESAAHWRRLADALLARDVPGAGQAARQLVQASAAYVLQQYASKLQDP